MVKAAPKSEWPHLNDRERQHVAMLARRRDYLRARIEEAGPDHRGLTFDYREARALSWVLDLLAYRPDAS